jgi:hypothetical protein
MSVSKILKELSEATECAKKRGESDQDFYQRLLTAVGELSDKEWDKLSESAQDWNNAGGDALEAKKSIPNPPDMEEQKSEKAEETTSRRRGRGAAAEEEKPAAYEPKEGDEVEITTKRKTVTGIIVEIDDEMIVTNKNGADGEEADDVETARSSVVSIKKAGVKEEPKKDAEPEGPADPVAGDTVTIVTGRDKTITGTVTEIDDDVIVIGDDEYVIAKLKSVKVHAKAEAVPSGRRGRAAAKEDDKQPAKEEEKQKRGRGAGGVSVGQQIQELVLDNLSADVDAITKLAKKANVDCAEATITLTYSQTHKFLKLLEERKMLKK